MARILRGGYCHSTDDIDKTEARFDYWRDMICDEFVKLDCERPLGGEFHGEIRGGVDLSELKFSEVISSPQHVVRSKRQIAKACDDEFLLSIQLDDQGIVRQDGREAILNPGDFTLYDSTRPYTLTFNRPFHQLVIQVPHKILSNYLVNPEHYTACRIQGGQGIGAVTSQFIRSVAQELDGVEVKSPQLSENLMNLIAMAFSSSVILKDVYQQSAVQDALLRRVKNYIENNLTDPELSLEKIAMAHGVTSRYLHKIFKEEEYSISRYILIQRLMHCRDLLADARYSGHSIEQIAFTQGFNSAAHFSRVFKDYFDCTPGEWRSHLAQ